MLVPSGSVIFSRAVFIDILVRLTGSCGQRLRLSILAWRMAGAKAPFL